MPESTPSTQPNTSYEPPQIKDHGTLADLTAATTTGSFIDGSYPAHTPIAGHLS